MSGDASGLPPFEAYRSYLRLLARMRIPVALRRHVDDSDIAQQTLLEAHRDAPAFRGRTPGEQMAWLRRILARTLTDTLRHLRRQRRDVARERPMRELLDTSAADLARWLADERTSPSERHARAEEVLRLSDAVLALEPDRREALILRHLHALGLEEIAAAMGRTPASVAGLVHRGLADLRRALGEEAAS